MSEGAGPLAVRGAIAAGLIAGAIVFLSVGYGGADAAGWQYAARYTARFSFLIFVVAFVAPAWAAARREELERLLVSCFAAAHGVHLGALITYRVVAGEVPPVSSLALGGAAYAALAYLVVAIARGNASARVRSGVLHYVLLVFVLTYATKISSVDQNAAGIAGVAVGAAAWVARLVGSRGRKAGAV